jgi:hypothetical protein
VYSLVRSCVEDHVDRLLSKRRLERSETGSSRVSDGRGGYVALATSTGEESCNTNRRNVERAEKTVPSNAIETVRRVELVRSEPDSNRLLAIASVLSPKPKM